MPAGTLAGGAMPGPKTGVQPPAADREIGADALASEPHASTADRTSDAMTAAVTTRSQLDLRTAI